MTATFYVLPFGNPSSGTFTAGFTGTTMSTAALAYDVSAANFQSALAAIVPGTTATGSGPWVVTVPAGYTLTVNDSGMPQNTSIVVQSTDALSWSGNIMMSNTTDYQSTGVATGVFTPSGGVSNLPALVDGQPGQPPELNFEAVPVNPGNPPTISQTQTSPGGAGQPSAYTVTIGVPTGEAGQEGPTATVSTASDVEGTPSDGAALIYSGADSKWKIQAIWVPALYSCQSFTAGSGTGSSTVTIASLGIPAQPFAWRPRVTAQAQLTGTVNTHLDLAVYLNGTSGTQVGYGQGVTGALTQTVSCLPAFGSSISGSSTYAEVAAGATATLYFVALQTASTTDQWSVSAAHASFEIEVVPLA